MSGFFKRLYMAFDRTERISEEVRHALTEIINHSVKDPRVRGTWSVTRCEVTRDLRYCKARVSVLEDEYRPELMKALKTRASSEGNWAKRWTCATLPRSYSRKTKTWSMPST